MAKLDTVNLVEMSDETILSIRSFSDDEEGNKEAEALFIEIAQENGATEEEATEFLEDGYHENGDYQLFICHS